MTTSEKSKCAHLPCLCLVQSSDKYCGVGSLSRVSWAHLRSTCTPKDRLLFFTR